MKIKLTEKDLTNIIKRIIKETEDTIDDIPEDLNDLVEREINFYDEICHEISKMDIEYLSTSIELSNKIQYKIDEIRDKIDEIGHVKYDRLNDIIDDYTELQTKLDHISSLYFQAESIKNTI